MSWSVYMMLCADGTLYTGITTDLAQRLEAHGGPGGARYLRGRTPVRPVYLESGHTRSSASRREAAIKKLRREAKQALIRCALNELAGAPTGSAGPGPDPG